MDQKVAINSKGVSCFIFLNTLFSFIVISHAPSTNSEINTICPKTKNPPYCTSALKSAGNRDLKGLIVYTVNIAYENIRKSQSLAKSLTIAAANPQLRYQYSSCGLNYDEAMGDIETVRKNVADGDFSGVATVVSGIVTIIGDCQDSFNQPPTDTSSLVKDGRALHDICSIVIAICNHLPKPVEYLEMSTSREVDE